MVDEPQLGPFVIEDEPGVEVLLVGCARCADEHLAAHAEVDDESVVGRGAAGRGDREPQVLAPATRLGETCACQLVGEVGGACHVPPGDSRAEELDVLQGAAGDVLGETAAHDLDLGELGHQALADSPSVIAVHATWAACCSATFFVRPVPTPRETSSTKTSAVKSFS